MAFGASTAMPPVGGMSRAPAQSASSRDHPFFHLFFLLLHEKNVYTARLREPYRRKEGARPWCLSAPGVGRSVPDRPGILTHFLRRSFTVTRSLRLFHPFPRSGFLRQTALIAILFRMEHLPADYPIIKKFYPKSKRANRGSASCAPPSLHTHQKAPPDTFAHFPEKFGRAAFLWERSFLLKRNHDRNSIWKR